MVDVIGDEDRCEGKGGLYSLDKDKAECLICGTTVANGVCLNKNETKLYFTDTPAQRVWSYDYDCESGTVSNKKEIAKFFGNPKPDGLALDDSGFLYITEWAGGKIDIFDTVSNKKADEILFPCKRITACCINNDTLYATTAKCGDADEIPYAGGVFVVKIK